LSAAGARVAVVERDAESGEMTADEIGRAGGEALAIRADVTDAPAWSARWTRWWPSGPPRRAGEHAGIVRDATLGKVTARTGRPPST